MKPFIITIVVLILVVFAYNMTRKEVVVEVKPVTKQTIKFVPVGVK